MKVLTKIFHSSGIGEPPLECHRAGLHSLGYESLLELAYEQLGFLALEFQRLDYQLTIVDCELPCQGLELLDGPNHWPMQT